MTEEIHKKLEHIFRQQKNNFKYRWKEDFSNESSSDLIRIENEISGFGPLSELIEDPDICEILVNDYNTIYFEKNAQLLKSNDHFYSEQTYNSFLDRLAQRCNSCLSSEQPFLEAQIHQLRITIIFGDISRGSHLLSIRKQPKYLWSLERLREKKFLNEKQLKIITHILNQKKNFIVVGGTNSGKTSFLQALLQHINKQERIVIIEDTQELRLPNDSSISLRTRSSSSTSLIEVNMDELLKRALRLRPDRLLIGEIRGPEARALLMALATGHNGSFGSLHARNEQEAILRLEMLIQMGAPQWGENSIKKLIHMTLQNIIVLEKKDGNRFVKSIFEINSLENTGFTFTRLDEGDN